MLRGRYFGLDQLCQLRQRFLPAKIALLHRYHVWQAFLHDRQLRPAGDRFEADRGLHLALQARVVEAIRVANALVGHELDVRSTERVSLSIDRKSTRLNSSHVKIWYAAFWLEKKK